MYGITSFRASCHILPQLNKFRPRNLLWVIRLQESSQTGQDITAPTSHPLLVWTQVHTQRSNRNAVTSITKLVDFPIHYIYRLPDTIELSIVVDLTGREIKS